MSNDLPANLVISKNKLTSSDPWLILLDIFVKDHSGETQQPFYLVNNNEDVSYDGQTYTAYPFSIEPPKLTAQGDIPHVTLQVGSVGQILQGYLELYDGGVYSEVTMRVVLFSGEVVENAPDLTMVFDVMGSKSEAEVIDFTLGAPNPLRQRFPLERYMANHCRWRYGSVECGISGESCDRTLPNCRTNNNSGRFGGEPGLNPTGIRLA